MFDAIGRRLFLAGWGAAAMPALSWGAILNEETDGSFRREVIALIKEKFPGRSVEPGGDPMSIKSGNTTISLDNIYKTVSKLSGGDRRQAILEFLEPLGRVDASSSQAPVFEDIVGKLRIQIAPRSFLTGDVRLLHRPLSEDTVEAVVIDGDLNYAYVLEDNLKSWNIEGAAVFERGIRNLDDASKQVDVNVVSGDGDDNRCLIMNLADGFCAARVLCPEFMLDIHRKLSSKIFLAIPTRDFMMAWTENFTKVHILAEQAAELFSSMDHPLTQEVFVSEGGELRLADAGELIAMKLR